MAEAASSSGPRPARQSTGLSACHPGARASASGASAFGASGIGTSRSAMVASARAAALSFGWGSRSSWKARSAISAFTLALIVWTFSAVRAPRSASLAASCRPFSATSS